MLRLYLIIVVMIAACLLVFAADGRPETGDGKIKNGLRFPVSGPQRGPPPESWIYEWDLLPNGELRVLLDHNGDGRPDAWATWPILAYSKTPAFCRDPASPRLMLFLPAYMVVPVDPNSRGVIGENRR